MSELLDRLGSYEPWTVDDLPDDDRRWELVDGVPVVSPLPAFGHQRVVMALRDMILSQATKIGPVGELLGVTPDSSSYRIPDLSVLRPGTYTDDHELRPSDFLLVVEVVSPSSVTTDRITKPAQYAAWGIGAFWRIETTPLTFTAHALRPDADVYAEVGTWGSGETVDVTDPFALRFELDDLAR